MGPGEYQTKEIKRTKRLIIFYHNFTVYVKWLFVYNDAIYSEREDPDLFLHLNKKGGEGFPFNFIFHRSTFIA